MNSLFSGSYNAGLALILYATPIYSMETDFWALAQAGSLAVQAPLAEIFSDQMMIANTSQDDHGLATAKLLTNTLSPIELLRTLRWQNPNGLTLIHYAARHGKHEFLAILCKRLKQSRHIPSTALHDLVTLRTKLGTPLELAIATGNIKTIKVLLKAGADANQPALLLNKEYPVILRAAYIPHKQDKTDKQRMEKILKITKTLLRHGANPQLAIAHPLINAVPAVMRSMLVEYIGKITVLKATSLP